MTMRATPRPSCRDREKPPLTFVDGGKGGAGVVSGCAAAGAVAPVSTILGSLVGAIGLTVDGAIRSSPVGAILASLVGADRPSPVRAIALTGAGAGLLVAAAGFVSGGGVTVRLRSKSTTMR